MSDPVTQAWKRYQMPAIQAYRLFLTLCEFDPPRIPGMPTPLRLAWRISNGATVEEAAAREYVYRWHLALDGINYVTPHTWECEDEQAPQSIVTRLNRSRQTQENT